MIKILMANSATDPRLLINNLQLIQRIAGITTFLEVVAILITVHFFPEINQFRWLLYSSAVVFSVFGFLYYFTPLALNPKYYMVPYIFFPFSIAGVMFILPSIAPFMIFILFELHTGYSLNFGARRLPVVVLLSMTALSAYFFLQPIYTPLQKIWLIVWLGASFIIYAYRDYRYAKELLNRRLEIDQMRKLTNELIQTKTHLSAERNKLEVTFASIADSIIALDQEQKIILVNHTAEKLLSLSKEEIIEKHIGSVLTLFENAKQIECDDYCPRVTLLEDKIIFNKRHLKLVTSKNQEYIVNVVSSEIKEGKVANFGCLLVIHDASREKELEEMQLDFVSIAAHELRTPLTSMRGYMALLKEELINKITNDQKTFLERASVSTDQLVALVENLLNVSRIERKALTIQIQAAKWEDMVEKIVADFSERATQKSIKLTFTKPLKPLPPVAVDLFRISEVISNLLANAISYTPVGGSVEISCYQEADFVVTKVSDTGQGIPKDALPRLFTKFFRVAGVLEQGSKGTGLGLYIAKAIIEMHKGKIWAESIFGHGAQFYFTVPVSKQPVLSTQPSGLIIMPNIIQKPVTNQ